MNSKHGPYEQDPAYEDVRRQIRILVVLEVLLGIAGAIVFAGLWESMPTPVAAAVWVLTVAYALALFHLHRGARWARKLVLVTSVIGLFGFVAAASAGSRLEAALDLVSGLLSVYQLVVLNTRRAKEYFRIGRCAERSGWGRFPTWLKVVLGVVGALAALLAALAGFLYWLISVESRMQVWVEDIETGQARQVSREGVNDWPSLAPDGERLAYTHVARHGASAGDVRICSLTDGRTLAALQVRKPAMSPTWDTAGVRLAFVVHVSADTSEVWIWTPLGGAAERVWTADATIYSCSWSPNGRWLALWQFGPTGYQLKLLPTGGEPEPPAMDLDPATAAAIRWIPDHSGLVYVRDERALVIRDPDSGEDREVLLPEAFRVRSLAFLDPRDTTGIVVSGTGPGGPQLARVSLLTGVATPWKQKRPLAERNYDLSRDGRRMAFARPGRAAR